MEKRKPHYDLKDIKAMIMDMSRDPFTATAKQGGAEMGLSPMEMRGVVSSLARRDFYKSMTTHADHGIWQVSIPPHDKGGYESGKVEPPVALVKLMKVLDKHPELMDELR